MDITKNIRITNEDDINEEIIKKEAGYIYQIETGIIINAKSKKQAYFLENKHYDDIKLLYRKFSHIFFDQ